MLGGYFLYARWLLFTQEPPRPPVEGPYSPNLLECMFDVGDAGIEPATSAV